MSRAAGLALALALGVGFTVHRLPSPDIWWHLANGQWILAHHQIPTTEPFSFTAAGQPWQNDEWLFSLLAFGLHAAGGAVALHVFKSVVLLMTLGIVVWHAQERTRTHPLAIAGLAAVCLCFSESGYFFDIRPQIFTYLFTCLFAWLVFRYAERGQARVLYVFPLLTCLWSNLHPGVVAGPFLLLFAAAGLWWDPDRKALARGLCLSALVSAVAATLNIVGPAFLLFPFRLWHSVWSQHLNEWVGLIERTADGWTIAPINRAFVVYLLVTVVAIARGPLHRWERSVYGAFAMLALTGWRHVPLFCFLTIPVWAVCVEPWTRRLPALAVWMSGGLVCGSALAVVLRLSAPDVARQSLENDMFPRWACDFLAANALPTHLFHPYGWGGYLIWRLSPAYQVFVDGRAIQAYPSPVYVDYLDAAFQPAHAPAVLDRYGVETVLCFEDPQWPECSARMLAGDPHWISVYRDDLAQVFLRRTPDNEARLPHLVFPPSPARYRRAAEALLAAGHADEARSPLAQALQLDAHDDLSLIDMGVVAYQQHDSSTGDRYTRQALDDNPHLAQGWINLAKSAANRGDVRDAEAQVQRALAEDPGNVEAQSMARGLSERKR